MTEQQPQRLSAEREAYFRQEADDCSSTASSWLPELLAELDAVRGERDEANVQDIGEALDVPHGSAIAMRAPRLAKQLHADLAAAKERIQVLEAALREWHQIAMVDTDHDSYGRGDYQGNQNCETCALLAQGDAQEGT